MEEAVKVSEAALLVDRNRKTLYRDYVATGKLTHFISEDGLKMIPISELKRVFGEFKKKTSKTNEKRLELKVEILEDLLIKALKGGL